MSYLSPGIYTKETDYSFYVKQISTSTAAMVGVAEKGPVNKPTLVTSWEQFVNKFGSYINNSYLAYAARAFFDNGGQVLYVNRVAHYTDITDKTTLIAVKSGVTIQDRAGTPINTLKINAINEGVWGDAISVEIQDGEKNPDSEFNLIVKYQGNVKESFKNLSMDDGKSNFVELAVNEKSEYITVEDMDSITVTPDDRPSIGSYVLTGGDDGLTDISDNDYIGDSSQHLGIYAFDEIDALNLLLAPGITTAAVIQAGIIYCENRQELMFIADAPLGLEPTEVVDFRKGQGGYTHAAFNSSYSALYYPWLQISDPATGKKKLIPPSGAVAGCYARSDRKTYVWYAPAGIDRGRIFNALVCWVSGRHCCRHAPLRTVLVTFTTYGSSLLQRSIT